MKAWPPLLVVLVHPVKYYKLKVQLMDERILNLVVRTACFRKMTGLNVGAMF